MSLKTQLEDWVFCTIYQTSKLLRQIPAPPNKNISLSNPSGLFLENDFFHKIIVTEKNNISANAYYILQRVISKCKNDKPAKN